VTGLGGKSDGYPRQSGFDITAASEVMAILCMCADLTDLKRRLGNMLIALTYDKQPVYARDLKVEGALAMILKDAIKPNLVQTIEGQPAFIHGGPFANIAHGNNSVIATKMALKLADYVVTEGGFAADLGAEKFFDIVSPVTGIKPDVAVLVVSVRALKCHADAIPDSLYNDELAVLRSGFANMDVHIENLTKRFGLPVVVAINRFPSDSEVELECVKRHCADMGINAAVSEVVARGGEGGIALGEQILNALTEQNNFSPLYSADMSIKDKIDTIAKEIYRADGVIYSKEARKSIDLLNQMGYGSLPVCIAKTQMSLSDDPVLKGAPKGFKLNVREIKVSAGAGFIVAVTGAIMTMPGLPKRPAAENIDIDAEGNISGLF
jgi:formate--tetrahydrofolate ligase